MIFHFSSDDGVFTAGKVQMTLTKISVKPGRGGVVPVTMNDGGVDRRSCSGFLRCVG